MLISEDLAKLLNFKDRPLFEVILPMTKSAKELLHIQDLFRSVADFKNNNFNLGRERNSNEIDIIPLLESFESQVEVAELLREYLGRYKHQHGYTPNYIRCFFAGSDSALESGFLTSILGNKIAISRVHGLSSEIGINIYPIIGFGCSLFRGGFNPTKSSLERFVREFPGIRTVTIQSSFRYDYPKHIVKEAVK